MGCRKERDRPSCTSPPAQTLLHQWLSEYAKKHPAEPTSHLVKVHTAAIELDLQTQNLCFEKIKEIMELHYSDINIYVPESAKNMISSENQDLPEIFTKFSS